MAQSFAPRDTYSKLELSISCTNLKDLDHFSKSDPCVFLQHQVGREWVRLGRTEVIDNNLSPKVLFCPELYRSPGSTCMLVKDLCVVK